MKIAIVGGGPTRVRAPFDDSSWEIWGFSSKDWKIPRVTRWFEIHAVPDLKEMLATKKRNRRSFEGYMRFMRELKAPVYMQEPIPEIPQSLRFPVEELLRVFGRCFSSTASFMVGYAILEQPEVLGVWGVNPTSRSFAYQRPTLEYLFGIARSRGIELVFPRGLKLDIPKKPRFVEAKVLYAYDWRSPDAWWRKR